MWPLEKGQHRHVAKGKQRDEERVYANSTPLPDSYPLSVSILFSERFLQISNEEFTVAA